MIAFMSFFSEIAFRWMVQDPTNDKSTLVHVMAWWPHGQVIKWTNVD